ncbi:MAG: T9SS type A sorting domain-containing protein [Chlorobi bacterium]|nr:T9SS type A sorting domain-containing protein [Chlorobiota bacterium]
MNTMKYFTQAFFFLLISHLLNAQISTHEKPVGYTNLQLNEKAIPIVTMQPVNVKQLLKEDEFDEATGDIPWRFGKDIDVSFNLNNSGQWIELANGDHLWRLNILSKGAYSINLIYDYFDIPEGAKLFIYNVNKTYSIGAFTNKNIKPDKTFATGLVKGESIIVEYYEPKAVYGTGKISISKVIHAYKDFFSILNKGYGSSGSCNNNVNCPVGDDWQNEKRSVVMILLSSNTRWCSGALINNAREDGTPYMLTANHCLGGENSWIIMFNYESPGCENQNGPTDQTIQYTTLLANNSSSDFALVQLSETPPSDYNVYYSGWSRVDTVSEHSTAIHHPSGDIKKISFDYNPSVSADYEPSPYLADSHWKIVDWDDGTTEPGSSGSPLFDQNHRIIGQLHGGWASCTSQTADFYGKVAMSWDRGANSSTRLKDWLDPENTGITTLNGWDPQADSLDAGVFQILEPIRRYCGEDSFKIKPKVIIINEGLTTIDSMVVAYYLNNSDTTLYYYNDSLEPNQIDTIFFPLITLPNGNNTFSSFIYRVNNALDEDLSNDSLAVDFDVILNPAFLNFNLTTDNYGNENSWNLKNENGEVLYTGNRFSNNETYENTFCLDTGCYTFAIYDSAGDGINDTGSVRLFYPETNYTIFSDNSFGTEKILDFCIYNNPVADFELIDTSTCMNEEITFTNKTTGEIKSEWYFEGGSPEISYEQNPTVFYENSGVFKVSLKVQGTENSDSLLIDNFISVKQNPVLNFSITPATDSASADGSVTANASNGEEPYSYRWNTGNLSNSLNNIASGTYYITVTDANGCKNTDSIYVYLLNTEIVNQDYGIYLYPTLSDGTITIVSENKDISQLEIIDLFGRIIYLKKNPDKLNIITINPASKGVYFVRFSFNDNLIIRKFVIR